MWQICLNYHQRMGILPLKKCVSRDKCSFATKQRMFGVWGLCNRWDPSLSRNSVPALHATLVEILIYLYGHGRAGLRFGPWGSVHIFFVSIGKMEASVIISHTLLFTSSRVHISSSTIFFLRLHYFELFSYNVFETITRCYQWLVFPFIALCWESKALR